MKKSHSSSVNRRDFLKVGAAGAAGGLALTGCKQADTRRDSPSSLAFAVPNLGPAPVQPYAAEPIDNVRIAFVGVGGMGTAHVRNLVRIEGCQVTAICDINEDHANRASDLIVGAGFKKPTLYTRGETDFIRLCETEDVNLVYNATPWRWHVPICIAAMQNGKHAATEVPAAYTIEDCWKLVETAEKFERHCVMMENCNYGRSEMMILSMVRNGVLGDVLHAECGYLHDLRAIKFSSEGEGLWRREHAKNRNGNLYPTHGLGPAAQCLDINRGDQFSYLVSMSSPSKGLQLYARDNFREGSPMRDETYVLGDVNVSLIKTVRGRSIFISHDCNLPRPYSRINMVQGTRGLFQGYPDRVFVEGRSEGHNWDDSALYKEEFDHPFWKELEAAADGAGHGGMDFIEDYRLIKCLREGLPTDMDVYDAAAVSAVCELSEKSVASGSMPVEFPDFTRGRWKTYPQRELGLPLTTTT